MPPAGANPMGVQLYRFDNLEAFPLLDSCTSCGARAAQHLDTDKRGTFLCLELTGGAERATPAQLGIALPPRAVRGLPENIELEVLGDARGGRFVLEVSDDRGWGLAYELGPIDFNGWRGLSVSIQQPARNLGKRQTIATERVVPPLQFQRLLFELDPAARGSCVGVRALSVSGEVELVPTGIA